jgi:arginine/lysine/ornithine decarboxylase
MLQTTSPSYVLLGSCDYALGYMRGKGRQKLAAAIALVEDNIIRIEAVGGYRCVTKDVPPRSGAYDRDIMKLVIDVTDRGISGFSAARKLAGQGVCVEAADTSNVLLVCTVMDGREEFDRLKAALRAIKGSRYNIEKDMTSAEAAELFDRQPVMDIRAAVFARRVSVPLLESVGGIAAVSVGAYPPGVPVIMPGQKITYGMVEYIARLRQNGYMIFGSDGNIDIIDE